MKSNKTSFFTLFLVAIFPLLSYAQVLRGSYGVHASDLTRVPLSTVDVVARQLDSANIRWVRMVFAWNEIQPSDSLQWLWGDIAQRLDILSLHNINVLGILYKVPAWASSAPVGTDSQSVPFYAPKDTLRWMRYIDSTVRRFKGFVHYWEIWNELDGPFLQTPVPLSKHIRYVEILRTGYRAIKQADSSATVLIGGLTSEIGVTPAKRLFADSIFALGAANYFDVMNLHLYRYEDMSPSLGKLYSLMVQYNKPSPVWVTETNNWRSLLPNNTRERAADSLSPWLNQIISLLRNPATSKIFWFNLIDFRGGRSADSTAWGLFDSNYTTTVVYSALKNYIAGTTGITEQDISLPTRAELLQNYPNPFNPTTTIGFALPQGQHVTLKVFDLLGREVATLVDGELSTGEHSVVFDAKDLPSGIYLYRLNIGGHIQTRSMMVLR